MAVDQDVGGNGNVAAVSGAALVQEPVGSDDLAIRIAEDGEVERVAFHNAFGYRRRIDRNGK